jgi:hypothetical protein
MTVDLLQMLYYAGFALLGWWLRHQGVLGPSAKPATPPPLSMDPKGLVELLKALLERLSQQPSAPAAPGAATFHVPIEIAASPRQPSGAGGA